MNLNFLTKIKATQKLAKEKNVHNWYNCILQSIMIIFISSTVLSVYTTSLIFDIKDTTPISQIPMILFIMPFIFTMILSYVLLEKLIIFHILLYEKIHKSAFKAWQNFDMWYYRKYRKHSPLTEILSKIQARQAKLGKNKRRLLLGLVIAGFILLNIFVRIPAVLDSIEETKTIPVIDQELDQEQKLPQEKEYEIKVRGAG